MFWTHWKGAPPCHRLRRSRVCLKPSLPEAFEMIKEMRAEGLEWGEGYRPVGRKAVAEILEGRMADAIDRHLEEMAAQDEADRRNGAYRRWLLTGRSNEAEKLEVRAKAIRARHTMENPVQ